MTQEAPGIYCADCGRPVRFGVECCEQVTTDKKHSERKGNTMTIKTLTKKERRGLDGKCLRLTFANGYTLSAVSHRRSYGGERGLWECAFYKGRKGDMCGHSYALRRKAFGKHIMSKYDHVAGFLTESAVMEIAARVAKL
jgi:hypothetical protein